MHDRDGEMRLWAASASPSADGDCQIPGDLPRALKRCLPEGSPAIDTTERFQGSLSNIVDFGKGYRLHWVAENAGRQDVGGRGDKCMLTNCAILIFVDDNASIARVQNIANMPGLNKFRGRFPYLRIVGTGISQVEDRGVMSAALRKGFNELDRPAIEGLKPVGGGSGSRRIKTAAQGYDTSLGVRQYQDRAFLRNPCAQRIFEAAKCQRAEPNEAEDDRAPETSESAADKDLG
jgi:hypothetical protein